MKIADYIVAARSMALYPTEARFTYPALGLCDEIGESLDKIFPENIKTPVTPSEVAKELGDVLWYIVNTALDLNVSIPSVIHLVTGGIEADTFGDAAFRRVVRHDKRSPYLKLTIYAAKVAGIAKKSIRDTEGQIHPARRVILADCLREVLVALFEVCERHGISPDAVAKINIEKLTSRKDRGKLKGEGDNR